MKSQRKEGLLRILISGISGIIFYIWTWLTIILSVINLVWTILSGEKIKEFYGFSEEYSKELNIFARYVSFTSDDRPLPFKKIFKKFNN